MHERIAKPIDRTSWPVGHCVSMTIDHDSGESVGTCECGFVVRVPRDGKTVGARIRRSIEMDDALERHWLSVDRANPDIARVDGRGHALPGHPIKPPLPSRGEAPSSSAGPTRRRAGATPAPRSTAKKEENPHA